MTIGDQAAHVGRSVSVRRVQVDHDADLAEGKIGLLEQRIFTPAVLAEEYRIRFFSD